MKILKKAKKRRSCRDETSERIERERERERDRRLRCCALYSILQQLGLCIYIHADKVLAHGQKKRRHDEGEMMGGHGTSSSWPSWFRCVVVSLISLSPNAVVTPSSIDIIHRKLRNIRQRIYNAACTLAQEEEAEVTVIIIFFVVTATAFSSFYLSTAFCVILCTYSIRSSLYIRDAYLCRLFSFLSSVIID